MSLPQSQWAPSRELSNAKFEGYKLSFDDDYDDDESRKPRIKLPAGSGTPGRTLRPAQDRTLGFREARNRAKWNHLSPGNDGTAAWIDNEGAFWLIDLTVPSEAVPRKVVTLPETILTEASSSTAVLPEYPTARHLQDSIWALTDGLGTLYTVDTAKSVITSSFELLDPESNDLQPFGLHSVAVSGDGVLAVVSHSKSLESRTSETSRPSRRSKNVYNVEIVRIPGADTATSHGTSLERLLTLTGSDLPSYTAFLGDKCCIGSTANYFNAASGTTMPAEILPSDPKPDELVGIPRAPDNTAAPLPSETSLSSKPPRYTWNQMSDSLVLVFPLPSTVNAADIKVVFTPTTISLTVNSLSQHDSSFPVPHILRAKLWDQIDAGVSTWTWEKLGGDKGKFGILSLHLEKKNEDVRWPHIFKQDDNSDLDRSYLEVEETLDRSELLKITEALEKYTSDLASDAKNGMASIEQRSSLLGDEIDTEVDAPEGSSGRGVVFTWIEGLASSCPKIMAEKSEEMADLVSMSLPRMDSDSSIIIKYDVDGLLFQADDAGSWQQKSTYPALSFVLASKRDVVQVYHLSDRLCIGLEAGSPIGSHSTASHRSYSASKTARMNAYLYYPPPPGSKAKHAKQKVVGLSDSNAGAVLGAIALQKADQTVDIAVLCEKEMVVLRGVL